MKEYNRSIHIIQLEVFLAALPETRNNFLVLISPRVLDIICIYYIEPDAYYID